MHAPADVLAADTAEHEHGDGEDPEKDEDAESEDERVGEDLSFVLSGETDEGHHLQRDHGEDAGHDIKNDAAEEGREDDPEDAAAEGQFFGSGGRFCSVFRRGFFCRSARRGGGGGARSGDEESRFAGAGLGDDEPGEFGGGGSEGLMFGPGDGDRITRNGHGGIGEGVEDEVLQRIKIEFCPVGERARRNRGLEDDVFAFERDGQRRLDRFGELVSKKVDHTFLGSGDGFCPGLQSNGEVRLARYAGIGVAHQEGRFPRQGDGLAGLEISRGGDRNRVHDGGFVSITGFADIETVVGDEFFRNGELELTGGESGGQLEFQRSRDAGLSGIDPVSVPGRIDGELKSDREWFARLDRAVAGDEARLHVFVADRIGLRQKRCMKQKRKNGDRVEEESMK